MEGKSRSISPLVFGIIAAASPLPMYCFSILWCWFLLFDIWIGLLGLGTPTPDWFSYLELFPLAVSPMLGIFGAIFGIVRRKHPHAILGTILSVLGIVTNFVLVAVTVYLGYRF